MLEDCIRISELHKQSSCLYPRTTYMTYVQLNICTRYIRIRLNYATPHHPAPPPTTTHHQPKYIHHHPPPPTNSQNISTTTHHHPPAAKIHLPPPTTTQKMDYHPAKAKIYSYIAPFDIVLTVSFSSKCNISVMEILCDKVLISLFFKFKVSTTFYII